MNFNIFKKKSTLALLIGATAVFIAGCGDSSDDVSEEFPNDTIEIIAAFAAGGSNDSIARLLSNNAQDAVGTNIIVNNVTGGGGSVGQTQGANADPDGYTLTMITASIVSNPLFNNLPYTHEDFAPVILINNDPQYLVTNTESGYDSIEDFIKAAEESTGSMRIGVSGAQTTNAFASREFAEVTGLDFTIIPHDGSAEAILAIQGGHIDAVVASYTEFQGAMQSGDLQPILNFGGERSDRLEDVPTALELDYDIEYTSWRGIGAPADTDPEIIQFLHDHFKDAIESEDFESSMNDIGLDVDYMGPEDFQALINETYDNYEKFVE